MITFKYNETLEATECLYNGKVVARLFDYVGNEEGVRKNWVRDCEQRSWNEEDELDPGQGVYLGAESHLANRVYL